MAHEKIISSLKRKDSLIFSLKHRFETWYLNLSEEPQISKEKSSWKCRRTEEEIAFGRSKLHNEDLNNFYSSRNTIMTNKSGNMRWAGLVASMGRMRSVH